MVFDANGHITKPLQSAFLVSATSGQSNLSDDTTIAFGTEIFDQNNDFASNTFTAPVTGRYLLNVLMYTNELDYDGAYAQFKLITSNRNYLAVVDPGAFDSNPDYWSFSINALADMDASDTATVQLDFGSGHGNTIDISVFSYFSGVLVC
tara:strand:- start:255 stop:704 length:450 start_codon:yes stop_codon:yes gene_type:complete